MKKASRARRAQQRKRRNRRIALTLCLLFAVLAVTIGGTVAWLTAETDPVVNAFTYGDINITLTENKPAGKAATIVPGVDIEKNPKVTVRKNSEDCWLFVKVEKTGSFVANKVTYAIADGWTELEGNEGVYYREVAKADTDREFDVLKDNKVTVSADLTKAEIENRGEATLTFTAYAVQKANVATAADAWEKADTAA